MCNEVTKLIFNISKYIYIFYCNLVYFFLIIYIQYSSKPSYIKYHNTIRVLHGQLTSCFRSPLIKFIHFCNFKSSAKWSFYLESWYKNQQYTKNFTKSQIFIPLGLIIVQKQKNLWKFWWNLQCIYTLHFITH